MWINPGHLPDRDLFWIVPDGRPHLDRPPQSWNSLNLKAFVLALDFLHNLMGNGRFWLQMGPGALSGGKTKTKKTLQNLSWRTSAARPKSLGFRVRQLRLAPKSNAVWTGRIANKETCAITSFKLLGLAALVRQLRFCNVFFVFVLVFLAVDDIDSDK